MPTNRSTVMYDVHDFKVKSLLTDVATAPTYGTELVDIPGIASVNLDPNINSNELKGDAKVIAKKGNTDRFNISATYGRLSLDALVIFFGGTITDVPTPSSVKWALAGTNSLPYFQAQAQFLYNEVQDAHLKAWKCQATGGSILDQSTDNFGQPKIDMEAIPCTSDDTKFVDIEFFDVVTPII